MNTAKLSVLCRCGHARRFHQQGTIWEGYDTRCTHPHTEYRSEYALGCMYFEAADGWEEAFAERLRDKGYLVYRPVRDRGRFVRRPALET